VVYVVSYSDCSKAFANAATISLADFMMIARKIDWDQEALSHREKAEVPTILAD
jgi:hypothetical protein